MAKAYPIIFEVLKNVVLWFRRYLMMTIAYIYIYAYT